MISTKSQMLFSVSAVRRLFGVLSGVKVRIQEWYKVVWVHIQGKRPTLVSKKVFLQHFVEWRKAQAQTLQVTQRIGFSDSFSDSFIVENQAKDSRYNVRALYKDVFCDCEDFKNQSQFIGRACCKHAYAVLNYLGFNSLSDYIERSPSVA